MRDPWISGGSRVVGETILHYKIIDKLGQGGMDEIYLAEDHVPGTQNCPEGLARRPRVTAASRSWPSSPW